MRSTNVVHWVWQLEGSIAGICPQDITPLVPNIPNNSIPINIL